MKKHTMMWRVLSLVVALFAALSLTFAPVLAPNFNLAPAYADEDDDDDDDDGGRLDFGFVVTMVSSTTGTGNLQGFITATIRAERGRVFRGVGGGIGHAEIPMAATPITFEWVVSRKRRGSAKSDTLFQLSNLGIGPDSITITRQYFDQDGDDCTQGTPTTTLLPGESVMIHVSEELMPVCP